MIKEDMKLIIKEAEKKKVFPQEFINLVEYFHSSFAYILSLIEMSKENKN